MQDLLDKMYSIENFSTYLVIAIVVLIVLFVLVLMLGKKDQKLEETKRLQRLSEDGFKDQSVSNKVEVKKENVDILLAKPSTEAKANAIVDEIEKEVNALSNDVVKTVLPVIEPVEQEIKIELPEMVSEIEDKFEKTEVIKPIELAETKFEEPIKVEPIKIEPIRINVEPKEEVVKPIQKEIFSSVYSSSDESSTEEIELPKLKSDDKEAAKTFNFDALSGETYNIRK